MTKNQQPEPSAIVDVMEAFDSAFRYDIGASLAVRTAVDTALAELRLNGGNVERFYREAGVRCPVPNAFVVTSRYVDQCPGGVQFHYVGFLPGKDGASIRYDFLEHQLIPYTVAVDTLGEAVESARAAIAATKQKT